MYRVDVYLRVRRAVMVEGVSIREASRVFGLHRDTVRKMLAYPVPPGYRRQTFARRPKLELYTGVIDQILEKDHGVPKKQRHTAKRIYRRVCGTSTGSTVDIHTVKDDVWEHRRRTRKMFVPLSHRAGPCHSATSARPWWSSEVLSGRPTTSYMDLPHSDGCFRQGLSRRRPPRPSWMDHVSDLCVLGLGFPKASCTTIPSWRWPGYWETVRTPAHPGLHRAAAPLAVRRPVRTSRQGQTTRARSRAWWAMCGAISWCRCHPLRASMRSMLSWSGVAWSGWTPGSGATRRNHRAADGAGPGGAAAVAGSSPTMPVRRQAGRVSSLSLVPVSDQRLPGAGDLRTPRRNGAGLRG